MNPIANYIPFTEEQREQARQTDLVAFLRQCGEIVKPSGSEFQWNNDGQKITIRGNVCIITTQRAAECGTVIPITEDAAAVCSP